MNQSVHLSVIVCTYNGERYLAEQLDTLLQQSYPIDEILIQDDASTDHTLDIARSYATRHSHIRVEENTDKHGVNGNFFSAMRKARGKYIAICDQDDLWLPDKLALQMAAIGQQLLCVCRSQPFAIDGSDVDYDARTPNYHLIRLLYASIPGHTMLLNRRLLDLLPDTSKSYGTYYDVFLASTAAAYGSLVLVDRVLVKQRRHPSADTFHQHDPHRSPSAGNGLYIIGWSLYHYKEVQPYIRQRFAERLELFRGIHSTLPVYREAVDILRLQTTPGLWAKCQLTAHFLKHRHHLFYAEGHGLINAIRALLYPLMQTYNFYYLVQRERAKKKQT